MEFAIVIFTDEEESTGIVATNWMNYDRNICWFPNVIGENLRHKYLITRESPKNQWLVCPIRVLKEFASYEDARKHLQEAEDLSALKHDSESKSPCKRKRKTTSLPVEESSDEEDEFPQMKTKRSFAASYSVSPVKETFKKPTIVSVSSLSRDETSNSIEIREGSSGEIEQLELNQKTMWVVVKDILKTLENIDSKLDKLMIRFQNQQHPSPLDDNELYEDIHLISSLPTDFDGFNKLCKRMKENLSFRKRLTRILMNGGGKDAKSFANNILRRVITDEVGERFSLTGKSHRNGEKVSFEKTELYRLILEICCSIHKNEKVSVVREAISEWLLQSKFRRSRREQRMIAAMEKDE